MINSFILLSLYYYDIVWIVVVRRQCGHTVLTDGGTEKNRIFDSKIYTANNDVIHNIYLIYVWRFNKIGPLVPSPWSIVLYLLAPARSSCVGDWTACAIRLIILLSYMILFVFNQFFVSYVSRISSNYDPCKTWVVLGVLRITKMKNIVLLNMDTVGK